MWHAPRIGFASAMLLAATLSARYPGGDAVYAQRQAAERHAVATQNLRAATAQTFRGTPVEGEAPRMLTRVVKRSEAGPPKTTGR
jgi:hypothetical protein